jgi:hypothetical protein
MKPTDEQLLDAVRDLFDHLDPPPADLADGALARIGVEDLELEYELLALVDSPDQAAVRGGADTGTDESVTLEFAGSSYRVLLRVDTIEGRRRVDGWVMPAVPMRVSLVPDALPDALPDPGPDALPDPGPDALPDPGPDPAQPTAPTAPTAELTTTPDDNGRFEFAAVTPGRFRVWLRPEPDAHGQLTMHPFATLPFLI